MRPSIDLTKTKLVLFLVLLSLLTVNFLSITRQRRELRGEGGSSGSSSSSNSSSSRRKCCLVPSINLRSFDKLVRPRTNLQIWAKRQVTSPSQTPLANSPAPHQPLAESKKAKHGKQQKQSKQAAPSDSIASIFKV